MNRSLRFIATALLAILTLAPLHASAAKAPVKVFILAGQSNMEGKVKNSLLDHQIKDAKTADLFAYLHKDGQYIEREDVLIDYLGRRGGLTPKLPGSNHHGVEVRFGHVIGDQFDEPVLLNLRFG